MHLDLMNMPKGETEAETNDLYLGIFQTIAETPLDESVIIGHAPWSWYPILYHLSCVIHHPRRLFPDCKIIEGAVAYSHLSKRAVRILSLFRPETEIAFELCDSGWATDRVRKYRKED